MRNIFNGIRNYFAKKHNKELSKRINDMVQVCEHNGELWFTYNGNIVCPMSLFNEKPIEVLTKIRATQYLEHKKYCYEE